MDIPNPFFLIFFLLLLLNNRNVQAQVEESSLKAMADAALPMSFYNGGDLGDAEEDNELLEGEEPGEPAVASRRSLFWHAMNYYISYGALTANRIPCPPRSGRSYYTHYCHLARGPVRPYYRGCSAITRCRR